jgi:hypothetical protein
MRSIFMKKNHKMFDDYKKCFTFAATIIGIDPWCNGNTSVFGAGIQGSSPCGSTKKPLIFRGFFCYNKLKKRPARFLLQVLINNKILHCFF